MVLESVLDSSNFAISLSVCFANILATTGHVGCRKIATVEISPFSDAFKLFFV